MTTELDRTIEDEAILWHLRLSDCDSVAWEKFVIWLEADPRHAAAYDAVTGAGEFVDQALAGAEKSSVAGVAVPANYTDIFVATPSRRLNRRWLGGAIAASLVLAMTGWAGFRQMSDQRYDIVTGAGEQRNLVMPDGTRIAMNGSSKLTLDHHDPRFAVLDGGEATFEVVHDAAHPFALHLGAAQVRDIGTVFNVIRESGEDVVEVKEGSVGYDVGNRTVLLKAGQALRAEHNSNQLVVTQRRVGDIGLWRVGRLNYDMASFAAVAQDVSRNLGVVVDVAPAVAGKQFSGTIRMDRDRAHFFHDLSVLLDVPVTPCGSKWCISASTH